MAWLALLPARWIGLAILYVALAFVIVVAVFWKSRQDYAKDTIKDLSKILNPPKPT
ncbi:hypothetical protein [Jiangella aurantiaca]|uniref:hypothetical protein n=1 Tax=Jiangella aurantiaca TaxID=2530373 RepID=UPI0013A5C049|nr:hypothetical protein [Jiangella aurantiaca]